MAGPIPDIDDPAAHGNILASWVENQPDDAVAELSQVIFDRLLDRAARPRHSSANACTKLCGFVQQSAKSANTLIQDWAFREETSLQLFDFYIEWNEKDQHRSMRLVLDLLSLLIAQNTHPEVGETIKAKVLQSLVSILTRQATRPQAKSSLNSLNHLLAKSTFVFDEVATVYRTVRASAAKLSDHSLWSHLVHEIFSWMGLQYVSQAAGKLLATIFVGLRKSPLVRSTQGERGTLTVDDWFHWLQDGLSAYPNILESIKNYILVPLFRSDPSGSLEFLERLNRLRPVHYGDSPALDTSAMLQLAALEVGKKSGLVEEPGVVPAGNPAGAIVLERVFDGVLAHPSPGIRTLALSLIISSSTITKPYSPSALGLLCRFLPAYHTDPDAKFRNEVLSHTKDMVKRLKGTMAVMQRRVSPKVTVNLNGRSSTLKNSRNDGKDKEQLQPPSFADEDLVRKTLESHRIFLRWYLDFLRNELAPTASYQRHVTAIKASGYVLQLRREISGPHESLDHDTSALILDDYAWIRSILDRIMDPFDDVRESSCSLLSLLPESVISARIRTGGQEESATLMEILQEFASRASSLASQTARAVHANGAARTQGLLCSWLDDLDSRLRLLSGVLDGLEAKLARAERDLGHAALDYPLHGDFASVRYIWEVLAKKKYADDGLERLFPLQRRIVENCVRAWQLVRDILCDDSPEGHLPEEMEDVEGLDTKDLLSYSFRAIHESSNTMRTIISTLKFSKAAGALCPSRQVFETVGTLTFNQLSNLRHRGAFTTVSQTFTACCQLAQDPHVSSPVGEETLLASWYQSTLNCIFAQESTTRRSAGIPALMIGILTANATTPSFDEVIEAIKGIAEKPVRITETDGSKLPQVHALNCIRSVFKSSLLSKRVERYLAVFLQLATRSLRSEVWAIRNCGLLLLRSLVDCLFGTGESTAGFEAGWDGRAMRISYARYPTLAGALLSLLKPDRDTDDLEAQRRAAESVFPALDILRRAGPPESHRDELYSCVVEYLGSHLWHVREMAARTVCSFLIRGDWVGSLRSLLEDAGFSSNKLHGTLLAAKFLIMRVSEVSPNDLNLNIPGLRDLLGVVDQSKKILRNCPDTRAALLEVQNLLSKISFTTAQVKLDVREGNRDAEVTASPREPFTPPEEERVAEQFSSLALLQIQRSLRGAYNNAAAGELESLGRNLSQLAVSDIDTARCVLEMIPAIWDAKCMAIIAPRLCGLYTDVCDGSNDPELRAAALKNLAVVLDHLITAKSVQQLPRVDSLVDLWRNLKGGNMNPSLSQAILRVSGPILAIITMRDSGSAKPSKEHQLRSWAAMVQSAGDAENTFDTRYAAVEALKSLASAMGSDCTSPPFLPFLLCLYDALGDDDDEIREVAAEAAGCILGHPTAPLETANALLQWMRDRFSQLEEFKAHTACRMVGHVAAPSGALLADGHHPSAVVLEDWVPAAAQLAAAMRFDDALFAVEEQNLFFDEVRETKRWAAVFHTLHYREGDADAEPSLVSLRAWAADGLRAIIAIARGRDDGPLGWTSDPDVFAVCARVLLSAAALARSGRCGEVGRLLDEFCAVGEQARVHGSLLAMARLQE